MIAAHQILLALAVAALAGAALRLASTTGARGLVRVVAAAPLGASIAVLETLALGLPGLGGSPVALSLAAGATWLAARTWLPAPEPRPRDELTAWWREAPPLLRYSLVAVLGAWLAWAIWLVRYPIGAPNFGPGVPLVNAERWDAGVEVRIGSDPLEFAAALTQGTLSRILATAVVDLSPSRCPPSPGLAP